MAFYEVRPVLTVERIAVLDALYEAHRRYAERQGLVPDPPPYTWTRVKANLPAGKFHGRAAKHYATSHYLDVVGTYDEVLTVEVREVGSDLVRRFDVEAEITEVEFEAIEVQNNPVSRPQTASDDKIQQAATPEEKPCDQ